MTMPNRTDIPCALLMGVLTKRIFRRLSQTTRPSRTAVTMVAKLSSARIISEASRATSVPSLPMATPISAALRAGASLTPSPVMEEICPLAWRALTMRILFWGEARAKTLLGHDGLLDLVVGHGIELGAGNCLGVLLVDKAEHVSDGGSGILVVSGNHGNTD